MEKNKGGRPTKYKGEETIKLAEKYLSECKDNFKKKKVILPKAEGLALYLGVSRQTLYEWAKEYPAFSYILEKINQTQADKVINESLAGNYSPTIAKLLLGKHGYKEEHDLTSGGQPITDINM